MVNRRATIEGWRTTAWRAARTTIASAAVRPAEPAVRRNAPMRHLTPPVRLMTTARPASTTKAASAASAKRLLQEGRAGGMKESDARKVVARLSDQARWHR